MKQCIRVVTRINKAQARQERTAKTIKAEQYLLSLETQRVTKERIYIDQNTGLNLTGV